MISRRDFLRFLALGSSSVFVQPALSDEQAKGERPPNILIVLSDDHSWHDSGCYGNRIIETPNIDALAARGMRFTHAFTGCAMCIPSRAILYTGLHPHRNGALANHGHYGRTRKGVKGFPQYFEERGYRNALVGKVQVNPAMAFKMVRMNRLDSFLAENKEHPLCMVVASKSPHLPWATESAYDESKIELPPYLVDTPETRRAVSCYYQSVTDCDKEVGEIVALFEKHGLIENSLIVYTSDHGATFPRAKWNLYDASLRVPFIASWPGRIAPGTVSDAMIHLADLLPTCIEISGGGPVEGLDGKSFAPVLLGKADEHHDSVFGTYTMADFSCHNPMRTVRTKTHRYIRNLLPDREWSTLLTIGRTANPPEVDPGYWKSWLEKAETDEGVAARINAILHRPAEELYDLRADPFELNNIAGDPEQGDLLREMRKALDSWMALQGDDGSDIEVTKRPPRRKKK